MISDKLIPELAYFRTFETQIPFIEDLALGNLVVAADHDAAPVYGWYRFKEAFSRRLLKSLLDSGYLKELTTNIRLLDPFCGSGTSLVACQELATHGYRVTGVGIERNPFIHFVAKAKNNWSLIDQELLAAIWKELPSCYSAQAGLPSISSISTGRCISRHMASRIVSTVQAIRSHGSSSSHDGALLAVASAIEPVSKVRKDGRALRLRKRDRLVFDEVLREKWSLVASDCVKMNQLNPHIPVPPTVIFGDGRQPTACGVEPDTIDLILTSPPYPNNIDYTEVYKLELWLLGFVISGDEFYELRRSTVRSHPSIAAETTKLDEQEFPDILQRLLFHAEDQEPWRIRMIRGYFSDMRLALTDHYKVLRKGGFEVLVVGNSLHGGGANPLLIPTDLVLSALAKEVGFKICSVFGTRKLRRRLSGNHFLRESIIILQ